MKKIILLSLLILMSCAEIVSETQSKRSVGVGNRWIDMDNIVELVQYTESTNNDITTMDILNFLGEPIYIERYNVNDKTNTLFWYKYKSKFYPILEYKSSLNLYGDVASTSSKQVKPVKTAKYEEWEDSEKWLVIISNSDYYEIIFTTSVEQEPKFKRELVFESLKFNKNMIEELEPDAAKALLENN